MAVDTIILDAAPLILQSYATLEKLASNFLTTPGVYSEIKDEQARQNLALWGDKLVIRSPKPQSMTFVTEFAKKTGDYAVLSSTDLQILALSYEIHCEMSGEEDLRKEPMQIKSNAVKRKDEKVNVEKGVNEHLSGVIAANSETKEDGDEISTEQHNDEESAKKTEKTVSNSMHDNLTAEQPMDNEDEGDDWSTVIKKERKGRRSKPFYNKSHSSNEKLPSSKGDPAPAKSTFSNDHIENTDHEVSSTSLSTEPSSIPSEHTPVPDDEAEFETDEGWITSGNLQEELEKNGGDKLESVQESDIKVAMSTSDFAMQNVALQIGLNLVNPSSGMRIRKVRNYMLRCHACFKLCAFPKSGVPLQFCPRCGGNTLMRTIVSVSADGTLRVHLKKNMQWWHRGDRYALPSPQSRKAKQQTGHHGSNPNAIHLRADDKEYQQAIKEDQWKQKAHNKMLENWVGSGSVDNVMSPFAVSGFNRDITTQSRGVRVGRGRYVNSSRKKR